MGLFDLFKRKKHVKQETQVTVTFEAPKSENDYNYPWDERRQSANTDFSNVNFLCYFRNNRLLSDDPDQFGRAVSYKLHIYDPIKRRDVLLEQGFLRITAPAETLASYKVSDLKEILKDNALPTTGKKSDLISRIVLSVDLEKANLPQMCCLSEQGIAFINQNQDLVELCNNQYGITYEEYIAAKRESPTYLNYNDIIWAVFNRRELLSNGDYNTRSWNAHCRAKFLKSENKLSGALENFIYELYFELNDPSRVVPDSIKQYYSDDELRPRQIEQTLLDSIFELKEHFQDDMIDRCYKRIDVPKVLIQRKQFERLINDIFAAKEIDISNYLPKGLR